MSNASPITTSISARMVAEGDAEKSPLRDLARLAVGRSGADIERLVREARQKARRAGRRLSWEDIERALQESRPPVPGDVSWRMAVHEAGHVLAIIWTGHARDIEIVSLEGPEGGYVRIRGTGIEAETEIHIQRSLVVLMAGRAAELLVVGDACAGSGGVANSDLARATETALAMETAFGFGGEHPLLYRPGKDQHGLLHYDGHLAKRVHARLEAAHRTASDLLAAHRDVLLDVARQLESERVLEGPMLKMLIDDIRARIGGPAATPGSVDREKASSGPTPRDERGVPLVAQGTGEADAGGEGSDAARP